MQFHQSLQYDLVWGPSRRSALYFLGSITGAFRPPELEFTKMLEAPLCGATMAKGNISKGATRPISGSTRLHVLHYPRLACISAIFVCHFFKDALEPRADSFIDPKWGKCLQRSKLQSSRAQVGSGHPKSGENEAIIYTVRVQRVPVVLSQELRHGSGGVTGGQI